MTRSTDLTEEEFLDLHRSIRTVQPIIMASTNATAMNFAVKDGTSAGPPVPHLHMHLVPRKPGDFKENDQVYETIDKWSPFPGDVNNPRGFEFPDDANRADRTAEVMANESYLYRAALNELHNVPSGSAIPDTVKFGKFDIPSSQVFYISPSNLSIALVNLRPLCPGHVLVTSRRVVQHLRELTAEEYDDLWLTVRLVQAMVEQFHGTLGSTIGCQDGKDAGQSVPHVHVHILPL